MEPTRNTESMSKLKQRIKVPPPAMLVAALALWAGTAQAAIIGTYTTDSDFTTAVSGSTLETFSTQISGVANGARTTYDYGPFLIDKYSTGGSGSRVGDWQGRPRATLPDVIIFDDLLTAWGGFINTQIGGNGVGIQLTVELLAGNQVVGTVGAGTDPNNGFLGFLSSAAFNTVRLTSVGAGADNYTLDNMRYKVASQSVPEPASLALLGAGLLGMAVATRRRRGRG